MANGLQKQRGRPLGPGFSRAFKNESSPAGTDMNTTDGDDHYLQKKNQVRADRHASSFRRTALI